MHSLEIEFLIWKMKYEEKKKEGEIERLWRGVDICAIARSINLTFNNLTSGDFVYTYKSIRYTSSLWSLISCSFFENCFCPKNRPPQATLFSFPINDIPPRSTLDSKGQFIHPERQMHLVCTPRITAANNYAPAIRSVRNVHLRMER